MIVCGFREQELDQCRNYSGFHDLLIKISFGVIAAHGTRQIHIIPANRRSPPNFQIAIREHDLDSRGNKSPVAPIMIVAFVFGALSGQPTH
jgi:hypothetical protein